MIFQTLVNSAISPRCTHTNLPPLVVVSIALIRLTSPMPEVLKFSNSVSKCLRDRPNRFSRHTTRLKYSKAATKQNLRLALREDFPPSRHTYISQLVIALVSAPLLHRHILLSRLAISFLTAVQESCSINPKRSIEVKTELSCKSEYRAFPTGG